MPLLAQPNQIQALEPQQIPFIKPEQVPHLVSQTQIEAILPAQDLVQRIPIDKVDFALPAHAPYFTPQQVAVVAADREEMIYQFSAAQIEHLTLAQLPKLDNAQLRRVPARLIAAITPAQVPYIADDKIPLLVHPRQIQALESRQVPFVTPAQVIYVKNDYVSLLSQPKQIEALDSKQVPHVSNHQLKHLPLDKAYLMQIPEVKRRFLTEPQVRFIYTPKTKLEQCKHIFNGIILSGLGVGIALPFWLAVNFIWLTLLSIALVFYPGLTHLIFIDK